MIFHEKFYKNLLDDIDMGIYFVDKQRKIIFWSKGAEKISNLRAKSTGHLPVSNAENKDVCLTSGGGRFIKQAQNEPKMPA